MAQITDKNGENWVVRFSNEDMLDALCDLNINLDDFENMNAGALCKMLWYGVRPLAKARRVSKKAFWNLFPIGSMPLFAEVVGEAIEDYFPEEKKKGDEEDDSPPAPGASATS